MQRLVYTPRAYIFIKDSKGNIRDVSRYNTAGEVGRRVSAVSTAEITLRNPQRIFTTPADDGTPVFSPMDPITIYLKRVSGRPVRVFTGFLDKTVYLQLYPGTITLRASCTLKRLLYTFFDPALPYTQSFLAAYGWLPDPNNPGQWFSYQGLNDFKRAAQADAANYQKNTGLNLPEDGSLSQLLFATLKYIGGWNDEDIYVEALPSDLFTRVAELAKQFEKDAEETRSEFNDLMQRIIGSSSYGTGAIGQGGAATGTVRGLKNIVATMTQIANAHNVPPELVVGIWEIEWPGLHDTPGNPHYGWFQMQTANAPYAYGRFSVRPPTQKEAHDLGIATTAICEALAGWAKANPSLRNNHLQWAMSTQGVNLGNNPLYATLPSKEATARKWVTQYGQVGADNSGSGGGTSQQLGSTTIKKASRNGGKSSTTGLFSPIKGLDPNSGIGGGARAYGAARSYGGHAGVDCSAPMGTPLYAIADGVITYAGTWGSEGHLVLLKVTQPINGYPQNIRIGYGHMSELGVKAGDQVSGGDYIGKSGAGSNGQPHLHLFVRTDDSPANGTMDPTPLARAAARGGQPSGGPGSGGAGGGGSSDGSGSGAGANVMAAGTAGAFFAAINFPSMMEQVEAQALGGEKSLMNDKPLMPFIQQLSEAGLREFQSLPDGKFFAFYPDYFGEMNHRKPYWEIDDIEMLDGKIELSDDALVTHYYVVGDTTFPASNSTLNNMFSSGVVTVFNAFLSDSVLNRKHTEHTDGAKGLDMVLSKDEAVAFLERYGARPLKEDVPMIKHPYFEMFLAYQRFLLSWSKQFISTFSFTFMPELYPGGKVGFPDHGLQMYIEDVTHSWDYESGFITQSNLSAPSVYGPKSVTNKLPNNMVRAIVAPSHPDKQAERRKKESK